MIIILKIHQVHNQIELNKMQQVVHLGLKIINLGARYYLYSQIRIQIMIFHLYLILRRVNRFLLA